MSIWEYERRQKMEERVLQAENEFMVWHEKPKRRLFPYLVVALFTVTVLAPVIIEVLVQR